jgi:hypothetical protein
VLGFGGIVLALIESMPAVGAVGGVALIVLLYWEARSSWLPLNLFRSLNFSGANLLTLFLYSAFERQSFLFSSRFDTGARLLPDASRSRSAAFHSVDVLVVALVWRTPRSLRCQGSASRWSPDRGCRIPVVCKGWFWRVLLDHVLPGFLVWAESTSVSADPASGERLQRRCSPGRLNLRSNA